MEFKFSHIEGVVEILPRIFKDDRGVFFECYSEKVFASNGLNMKFVQDNQSHSIKGVLRGLHMQKPPFAQGKLVRVIKGKCIDVVVDCRKNSKTYGQHASFILDEALQNMVYVPEGFAHGFATFDETIFHYKCTNYYDKASETGILWNDKDLNIDWQISNPLVSDKDAILPTFNELMKSL